jgi:hypothetical protein
MAILTIKQFFNFDNIHALMHIMESIRALYDFAVQEFSAEEYCFEIKHISAGYKGR